MNKPQKELFEEYQLRADEIQVGGSHYKDLAIQPYTYCQQNNLNYMESCVIKYVTRHQDKGGAQDLDKAIHSLQMLKEMTYPEAS